MQLFATISAETSTRNGTLPIGLISATWSGTRIEAWESKDARRICNDTIVNDPNQASHLWNGMIHPVLWYNIRAIVWYQGESNEQAPTRYQCSFPEMIKDWRSKWGVGDIPFFFVQLAGYELLKGYVELRYAQTFALKLPLVDMVTAIDIGDPTNIRPTNKQEVSRRLTLLAGHYLYGSKEAYQGPLVQAMSYKKEGGVLTVTISFLNAKEGLIFVGTPKCSLCCQDNLGTFEILSERGWKEATEVNIDANRVIVTGYHFSTFIAIRYAWYAYPQVCSQCFN
jgi:sialate O-acetylesterase